MTRPVSATTFGVVCLTVSLWACQPVTGTTVGLAIPSTPPVASVVPSVDPPPTASPTPTPVPTLLVSARPSPTPTPVPPRTYSTAVQSVTGGTKCFFCHTTVPMGTYGLDVTRRNRIAEMAQIHGELVGLTPKQIADIVAWNAAGAPNDPTPF